ncbi:MAG: hypothetical protein M0Q99_04220 [Candidatus Cloacimonetes bacterium]|nr:hypothetical protein [Candidatus Cloacimonadota bacterium]MCK9334499.1 hypothetical protein [Candidatus Cloacimonadota bacterium]
MMRIYKTSSILLAVFFLTTSSVIAQTNEDIIFRVFGDEKHETELFIQRLSNEVLKDDPYFAEAYRLIDIDLPRLPKRDPELFKEAEWRFFNYRYISGIISARASFVYNSKKELKKMRSKFLNDNPPLYGGNYDTKSMVDQSQIQRQKLIYQREMEKYDNALKCANEIYRAYYQRYTELAKASTKLSYWVFNYKVSIDMQSTRDMENYLTTLSDISELAKRDIGAISESEYKWRNFCTHVIMPVFENTRYASPEEGFAGAIGAILEALPGQDQLSTGGKHEINRIKRK